MGILRSEDMFLYKFVITKDNAYQVIRNLGKINCTHFLDMNKNEQPFKLPYTDMIKRCEETERRLIYLKKECLRYKVKLITPENFEQLEGSLSAISKNKRKSMNVLFDELENEIKEKEQFVETQNDRIKTMHEVLNELIEYQIVLEKANKLIHGKMKANESLLSIHADDNFGSPFKQSVNMSRRHDSEESKEEIVVSAGGRDSRGSRLEQSFREVSIRYLAGTIDQEDIERFKRILFRASRGKILSYFEKLDVELKDFQGKQLSKVVYVLVFEEGSHLKEKILRLCDSFNGKRYHLPDGGHGDTSVFKRKISQIQQKLNDTKQMIKITREQMHRYIEEINQTQGVAFSVYEVYRLFIKKEKSVYQVLNLLQKERNLCYGFMWSNLAKHQLLNEYYSLSKNADQQQQPSIQLEEVNYTRIKPPTFIKTNDFTEPFQEIVNTYGVPLYKEINPAYFACVTFPFLFGIMFGDIGHGLVLFLVGFVLSILHPCIERRYIFLRPMLQMRYLILLMGFFATFSGLIYNDFMSIPLNIFESCYDSVTGKKISEDCIYPVGVDPIWAMSKNELTYMNSLKMKISVILGVLQMSLGVFMKALNARHFKNNLDLLHEFLPQIILLWVLFGYMDTLIILKWLTDYTGREHSAPSIITSMINMALNGGKIAGESLIGSESTNQAISIFFLLIALIAVPWMLFAKPLILRRRSRNYSRAQSQEIELKDLNADGKQRNYEIFVEEEDNDDNGHKEELNQKTGLNLGSDQVHLENKNNEETVLEIIGQNNHEEFIFSEVFIHQLIETIEFVLGTISNTASYLRLWALSLAHSQLAKVFFENTVKSALKSGSVIGLIISYPVWISATLFVLMSMDVMECFLHTLRLHWVEFQNKFYKGQGYKFVPFSYNDMFNSSK